MVVVAENIVEELWFSEDSADAAGDSAAQSFAAKVADLEGLKPFPAVAQRVIEILADPDFRVHEVHAAIEEDPALAGRVLRVANSAAFAGANPVDSVSRAVIRLGAATVRELVVAMATVGMFHDVTGRGRVVREHCVATGSIARLLARDYLAGAAPGMFLAGLMHDVGKLLLMQSGEFPTLALTPLEHEELDRPNGSHVLEREHLGYDHAVLGGHAVMLWKIPFPTPQVVAWHHQPQRASDEGDETVGEMVSALRAADQLERLLTADPPPDKRAVKDFCRLPECDQLGITPKALLANWSELFLAKVEASALFG